MNEALLSDKPVIEPSEPAEPATQATTDPAQPQVPRRTSNGWLAFWLLLLTAAFAGGGYYLWQQLQQTRHRLIADRQALDQKMATIQQRVDTLDASAHRLEAQSASLAELQSRQQSLEDSVGKLRSDLAGSARVWDVEQIAVLLQMANDRLRLEGELGPALAALQAADRHLQDLKNPGLLDVRRRLAEEINALESTPRPDVSGMALTLEALINGIDRLPLAEGEAVLSPATATERPAGWRGVLHDLWEEIKGLVVIKHRGQADHPLLPPDERYFLRQNLRLELETARLALLRRDRQTYQVSVRQAAGWIGEYFDAQAPAPAAALEELTRLQQTEIAPPLPDISASLDTLQAWLKKHKQAHPDSGTS